MILFRSPKFAFALKTTWAVCSWNFKLSSNRSPRSLPLLETESKTVDVFAIIHSVLVLSITTAEMKSDTLWDAEGQKPLIWPYLNLVTVVCGTK